MTFSIVDKDGRTVADNPKLAAYQYMARCQGQGRHTYLAVNCVTGEYRVEADGLLTLTFVPA